MRIVLESNVLLSAFGFGGVCRELVEICLATHEVFLSEYILNEFGCYLREEFKVPNETVDADTQFLRTECALVEPAKMAPDACRDPNDLPVLGTMLAARADCLVTGDADLLSVREFGGHRIISPRQLLDQLRESSPPQGEQGG